VSRSLEQIESLAAAPFILLVAAVASTIQALPIFLQVGSLNLATARFAQIALATGIGVLDWTGAAVLWWFAVRRRQYSILLTAIHVTIAMAVADLLMNGLGFVAASIETRGEFAMALGAALPAALSGPIGIALLRSPFWFVEALALVAVGRLVLHMDTLVVPPLAAATHRDTLG
jgi:hypothetical protein